MQLAQLEQLRRLISASPLLQDAERAHWLELLPLMNDKQLAELAAILQPQVNKTASPARASSIQQVGLGVARPSLAHLANLPTIVRDMGPVREPVARPPEPRTTAEPPRKLPIDIIDITEKELPSARVVDSQHLLSGQKPSAPNRPPPAPVPQRQQPPVPRPAPPPIVRPSSAAKSDAVSRVPAPAIKLDREVLKEPLEIKNMADLTRMDIETFHAAGPAALTAKLQDLVKRLGYFDIIFALEQSPLYADYVTTGQHLLEENATFDGRTAVGTRHGATLLSRPDFEAMADLLRQIQVN